MNNSEEGKTNMPQSNTDAPESQLTVEQWLDIRKKAGAKIDPETAEVDWTYGQIMDPYGVDRNLPEELYQVGRLYFARCPGSDIWVAFDDLSEDTVKRLRELHDSKLKFPAGLASL